MLHKTVIVCSPPTAEPVHDVDGHEDMEDEAADEDDDEEVSCEAEVEDTLDGTGFAGESEPLGGEPTPTGEPELEDGLPPMSPPEVPGEPTPTGEPLGGEPTPTGEPGEPGTPGK